MANEPTMMSALIDPEVMASMISAKVEARAMALPYVKYDATLSGQPGTTITIPRYGYTFGEAVEVGENEEIPLRQLETDTVSYEIKKIGIGGGITDEALVSAYGNPQGQIVSQMAMAITNKLDSDTIDELYSATTSFVASNNLCYATVVNAIDLFNEEINTPKVMFVNPHQVTDLRLDSNFISADKYKAGVMINGEIGTICNTHIVPSRKVKLVTYVKDNAASGSGVVTITADNLAEYQAKVDPGTTLVATDKVKPLADNAQYYVNPIMKLSVDPETEDETAALTFFVKRQVNVETERIPRRRRTEITGDQMYVVALTNESKVVLCKSLKVAAAG